jgi:ABC-2 type transport system permease protein
MASSSAVRALYSLVLRTQATRGRLISLGLLGLVGVLVAVAVASADLESTTATEQSVDFVSAFGLTFLLPITALVFSAASLGDFREDGSLVYLWLRPVPRWQIIVAALGASITVTLPLVLVPLVVGALIISPEATVVTGTLGAVVVGVVAYAAIFLALGLRTQRALLWGLVYILLWEGFVSRAGDAAARVSVSNYPRSILAKLTDTELELADASLAAGFIVPLVVAALAFAYASRRFQRQDVA